MSGLAKRLKNSDDGGEDKSIGMRGLIDLPERAFEVILEYLPFYSIKKIRCVNRRLYYVVSKLKSDFNLWTLTSENIQATEIPDFVINSKKDIAIKLEECEDDLQLLRLTNIFKRRIKRVTIEVTESIFSARSCHLLLSDIQYLKIVLEEQVGARIPWLAQTLKDSSSTLHTLYLVGVGLQGIHNLGSGLGFSVMKSLSIRFSYVPEEFLSIPFPNLEELYLSASEMRKINGAIGSGFKKLKILYVRDCSGDISRITKAIVKRSQSTLEEMRIGDIQKFPLGYEPGSVQFCAFKKLELACFIIPDEFFQTDCPLLRELEIDTCILLSVSISKKALPMFSRLEVLSVVRCKGEIAIFLNNLVVSCMSTLKTLELFGDTLEFLPQDLQKNVKFDSLHMIRMGDNVKVTTDFFKVECPKMREISMYGCKLPEKIQQVSEDFSNIEKLTLGSSCSGDVDGLKKFCPNATPDLY